MKTGKEGRRSGPEVWSKPQIEGSGKRIDAARLGYAAANGEIGLQYVDGAMGDEVAEVEAGELALTRSNRDHGGGAYFGNAGLVISGDWFFEPGQIAVADQMSEALGFGHGEGSMRIDHD